MRVLERRRGALRRLTTSSGRVGWYVRAALPVLWVAVLGCGGARVQDGSTQPNGAGAPAEGPVRYLDWSFGLGLSVKHWKDRWAEEYQSFPAYELSFVHHLNYNWDIEFSTWAGRFVHPRRLYTIQSFVHVVSVRWTRLIGLGWWHVSLGAGYCDNTVVPGSDDVDVKGVPAFKVAAGYTCPLAEPLSLTVSAGYIVNEDLPLEEWQGGSLSLSVVVVTASVAFSF